MKKTPAIAFAGLLLVAACNRVPEHVIQPEPMAQLMADVRVADAVVSVNSRKYATEQSKLALKKAVFERHGVTEEQFDTSLIWYGHNIARYQEVTDRSIEILELRQRELSAQAAGEAAMSVSGDSVDIWTAPQYAVITRRSPSEYLAFSYDTDPNWERGDIYTFRARLLTTAASASWNLTAEYSDGAVSTLTTDLSTSNPAKQEISLYTDSTRTAVRVSGWLRVAPDGHRPSIVDSVSVVRRRNDAVPTGHRRYLQRLINPAKNRQNVDTVATR